MANKSGAEGGTRTRMKLPSMVFEFGVGRLNESPSVTPRTRLRNNSTSSVLTDHVLYQPDAPRMSAKCRQLCGTWCFSTDQQHGVRSHWSRAREASKGNSNVSPASKSEAPLSNYTVNGPRCGMSNCDRSVLRPCRNHQQRRPFVARVALHLRPRS